MIRQAHWQWTKIYTYSNLTFASHNKYGIFSCFYSLFYSSFRIFLHSPLLLFSSSSLLLFFSSSSFLLVLFLHFFSLLPFLLPFLLVPSRLYPQRAPLLSLKWYRATGIISFHEAARALEGIEEDVNGNSISIGPTWVLHTCSMCMQ